MDKRPPYFIFISWFWLAGLLLFGVMITWHIGLLPAVLAGDQTRISVLLLVLTGLVSLHCGYRGIKLARLEVELSAWEVQTPLPQPLSLTGRGAKSKIHPGPPLLKEGDQRESVGLIEESPSSSKAGRTEFKISSSWAEQHLSLLLQTQQSKTAHTQGDTLQARLIEQVHGGHQSGWFMADLLLRLGLVGTVIGFVLMLGAVYGLEENEISALKQLLTSMGGGMQVALYTTLTGLGAATLLSIQCHWLDRCADKLVSRIIEMGVTDLPAFAAQTKASHASTIPAPDEPAAQDCIQPLPANKAPAGSAQQ